MSTGVFVDTALLVALTNRRDHRHSAARRLVEEWSDRDATCTTSDAVFLEYANFFARSPLRAVAIATIARLRGADGWTVAAVSAPLMRRAEIRYAGHPDKAWSLTDCLSMEIMVDQGVVECATTDHHFTQAGFTVLMR